MAVDTSARGMAASAAKLASEATSIKNGGHLLFANLPTPSASVANYIYTVDNSFTTDSRFIEGTGVDYAAGSTVSVIIRNNSYYLQGSASEESNYLKKTAQTLTDEEKAQVQSNIGVDNGFVKTTSQTLTDEEKAQAKSNIGVVGNTVNSIQLLHQYWNSFSGGVYYDHNNITVGANDAVFYSPATRSDKEKIEEYNIMVVMNGTKSRFISPRNIVEKDIELSYYIVRGQ